MSRPLPPFSGTPGSPAVNLRSDEMLGAVVERLLKALRGARLATGWPFFALGGQHMRWELNDLTPAAYQACLMKKEWLLPKWHGKPLDAVGFAYQCARTRNHYARLPFLAGFPLTDREAVRRYDAGPLNWQTVLDVNRDYLFCYPDDRWGRTRLAYVATAFEKWSEADPAFGKVGDKPWPGFFRTQGEYEAAAKKAKAEAEK